MAEYQRSTLFQAVEPSKAQSAALEMESKYFSGIAEMTQGYADKYSAKAGKQVGLDDGMEATRTITMGDGTKQEVPEHQTHPLAGFTAFGEAYNEASEVAYQARVEADFIETAGGLATNHPTDLQAFDKQSEVFEKAYFKGMGSQERVVAQSMWTQYKTKARSKVQVAAQKASFQQSLSAIDNSSFMFKAQALQMYRDLDIASGEAQREKLFALLDQKARFGVNPQDIEKEKRQFLIEQERNSWLGVAEFKIENGDAEDFVMSLYDQKFLYLEPAEADKLIGNVWSMIKRKDAMEKKAKENTKESIALAQDTRYTGIRNIALGLVDGELPGPEQITDMVSRKLIRDEHAKELQDLEVAKRTEGIDNQVTVYDLQDRLYSGDVPTIAEVIGHRREGRISNATYDQMMAKISTATSNPAVLKNPEYKIRLDQLNAAFGIKEGVIEQAIGSLDADPKRVRWSNAKAMYFELVMGGNTSYQDAATFAIDKWAQPTDLDVVRAQSPNKKALTDQAIKALNGAGVPVTKETFEQYLYGDFAN